MGDKNGKIQLILRFSKGTRGCFIIILLASLASTLLNSLIPRIFGFTIDRVLVEDGIPYLKEHIWLNYDLSVSESDGKGGRDLCKEYA